MDWRQSRCRYTLRTHQIVIYLLISTPHALLGPFLPSTCPQNESFEPQQDADTQEDHTMLIQQVSHLHKVVFPWPYHIHVCIIDSVPPASNFWQPTKMVDMWPLLPLSFPTLHSRPQYSTTTTIHHYDLDIEVLCMLITILEPLSFLWYAWKPCQDLAETIYVLKGFYFTWLNKYTVFDQCIATKLSVLQLISAVLIIILGGWDYSSLMLVSNKTVKPKLFIFDKTVIQLFSYFYFILGLL